MAGKDGKKQIAIGILAHVDAGKTSLSESILYTSGAIRSLGRVDKQTAFLDTDQIERNRGITVFSKEARFCAGDTQFTLLDTPGHVDFSMEAERTLSVLDYAILVVSGAEGVQAHTLTIWSLLRTYGVPVFVFVNKMDRAGASRSRILAELAANFGDGFADMEAILASGAIAEMAGAAEAGLDFEKIREELAMCSDELMEEYLAEGHMTADSVRNAIASRKLYPVYFGSALKMEGIEEFLGGLAKFTKEPEYPAEFGARVYKITRDKQGVRQTHMKITGGTLKSKMLIASSADALGFSAAADEGGRAEKVEQIRIYAGSGFQSVQEAESGTICAVTGLAKSYAGQGFGIERGTRTPAIEPTMSYKMIIPPETDAAVFLRQLRQLEEEEPSLRVFWNEEAAEINVHVMGELALEILQHVIEKRFGVAVEFGQGSPVYKETIAAPSVGIGHFEPLRHYAEVHLLLEPGEPGSGLIFDSLCSEDKLDRNWQRLIYTHLAERPHPGVLTGSDITDMKITIIAGRAHIKHTEGGDFRQATYRAVRQGLRKAKCVLLEPVVSFRLSLPQENIGRALSDMQRLGAEASLAETSGTDTPGHLASGGAASGGASQTALITGTGPAAALNGYQKDVAAYTKGQGRFLIMPAGYRPCKNQEEIVKQLGYEPERDIENPTGSVFCEHGAALYVDWQQVDSMAHVDSGYLPDGRRKGAETAQLGGYAGGRGSGASGSGAYGSGLDAAAEKELEDIFLRTYGKSKRDEALRRERISKGSRGSGGKSGQFTLEPLKKTHEKKGEPILIVDGYNVIFAWEELAQLAKVNIDAAREALLETLENYQGYKKLKIIAVFDGYKVAGSPGSRQEYAGVTAVYTKEAETADRFIEKTVYEMGRSYDVTVVTSDRLVQMISLGDGARRLSSREFYQEVTATSEEIRERLRRQLVPKNRPFEGKLSEDGSGRFE